MEMLFRTLTIVLAAWMGGCTSDPHIQGLRLEDPNGEARAQLRTYRAAPAQKALTVAIDSPNAWVMAVGLGQRGQIQAAALALQECNRRRLTKVVASPCELARINDQDISLGRALRERADATDERFPALVWEIGGGVSQAYLAGSFHLLKPTLLPLPNVLEHAYQESTTLVTEIKGDDLTPETRATAAPIHAPLAQLLPTDLYATLRATIAELGLDWSLLEHARPTDLSIALAGALFFLQGFDPQMGIDRQFIARANRDNKERLGLETAEQQMEALHSASDEFAITGIREQLDHQQMARYLDQLTLAWLRADTHLLHGMLNDFGEGAEAQAYQHRLFRDRNLLMAERINALLKQPGHRYLILVGAGHLTGDEGLVELLQQLGYQTVQLRRNGAPLRDDS